MKTCTLCAKPRWAGPNGTNTSLTMCEEHQQEYWRQRQAKRRAEKNEFLRASGQVPTRKKPGRKPGQKDVAARAKRGTPSAAPDVTPAPPPPPVPQRRQFNIRPFTPPEVIK